LLQERHFQGHFLRGVRGRKGIDKKTSYFLTPPKKQEPHKNHLGNRDPVKRAVFSSQEKTALFLFCPERITGQSLQIQ
jgi:hypothetical protein